MKNITTIVFDDRKATVKEHIAEPRIVLWASYPDSTSPTTTASESVYQEVKKLKPRFHTTVLSQHGREY